MKMILDDKNPRIRGCEFYEKYILVVIPGFQESPSSCPHGPRFSWEDRPTSKASSFCKTQPSNCGKVPLSLSSLSSLSSCFVLESCLKSRSLVVFVFFGLLVKSSSLTFGTLWLVTSFFSFCSHFGEARALPGDAVRPAGNQALNISPSQRILVWRYSRFPTLLPFRMQTMCHDYLCFRMIRILKKRLYLRVSNLQFWRGEGWFAISNKVQPWTHRQECLMGDVLFWLWGWVLGKHWNNSTDNVIPRLLASPCNRKAWKRYTSMCHVCHDQTPTLSSCLQTLRRSCSRPLARLRADAWWKAEKKDGRKLTRGLEKGREEECWSVSLFFFMRCMG